MGNNVSFRLAYASVKKDQRSYFISFIIMVIVFTLTITLSSFISTQEKVERLQKERDYGNWVVCFEGLNDNTQKFLESSDIIDQVTNLDVIGQAAHNNYIANYNEDFFNIASITLLDGRIPTQRNEVIVLESSGYRLNDRIELNQHQYQVVGIMNNYNQKWDTPSVEYFTYDQDIIETYTYITSKANISDLIGIHGDCIYNVSLSTKYFQLDLENEVDSRSTRMESDNTNSNDLMNVFIIIMSIGLFIAIFFNVYQREKDIFLLRCIGMSKKDMKKYIFYEMIIVSLFALLISIILGFLLSLLVSYIYSQITGIFVFYSSLSNSIKYIIIIMIIIISLTYLSILPISIHSIDSLIHKKNRKKLKKYNKIYKMNVAQLSKRIIKSHYNYIFAIVILIIVQATCLLSIKNNIQLYNNVETNEISSYTYEFDTIDPNIIQSVKDSINQYDCYRYIDSSYIDSTEADSLKSCSIFSLSNINYDLIEGRLPEKENECIIYDNYNNSSYSIGDTIIVGEEEYYEFEESDGDITSEYKMNTIKEMVVVGELASIDYELYNSYGVIVLDSAFEDDIWEDKTIIEADKNITFTLNHHFRDVPWYSEIKAGGTNYKVEVMQEIFMTISLFFISEVFMILIMRLFIDKLNYDLKLIRCLGMTNKQTIQFYCYIMIYMICLSLSYLLMYSILLDFNINVFFIALLVVLSINSIIFSLIAYKITSKTLTYYPSEVERYY